MAYVTTMFHLHNFFIFLQHITVSCFQNMWSQTETESFEKIIVSLLPVVFSQTSLPSCCKTNVKAQLL